MTSQPQPDSSASHALQDRGLVVDGEHLQCRRAAPRSAAAPRHRAGASPGAAATTGTSTRNTEPRPGSERSVIGVVEDAGDALDDRKAEPEAARRLGALVEALELAEHDLLLGARNAEPGVPDLDRRRAPRAAGSRRATRPLGVYLMAFETRFCSSRRSSRRSERIVSERGDEDRVEALLAGDRLELDAQLAQNSSSMRKLDIPASSRRNRAARCRAARRGSPRRRRARRRRFRRGGAVAAVALALGERRRVEARGVERLEDVVARRGEEARLRDVGLVGLGLGAGSAAFRRVSSSVRSRTRCSRRLIGARQRFRRLDAVGDVRIGRDDAAVGHAGSGGSR